MEESSGDDSTFIDMDGYPGNDSQSNTGDESSLSSLEELGNDLDMKVGIRVQAEHLGLKEYKVFSGKQLVMCEGWPSLAFTLEALGCKEITVLIDEEEIVRMMRKKLDVSFAESTMGIECMTDTKIIEEHWEGVWVQGSSAFVEKALQELDSIQQFGECTMLVNGLKRRVRRPKVGSREVVWTRLSHANLGGVTSGRWEIGSTINYDRAAMNSSPMVFQRLGDVLKCTEPGITCGSLYENEKKRKLPGSISYIGTDLIPVSKCKVPVVAPFVKNSSGFVKRVLTSTELADIYDLQGKYITQLSTTSMLEKSQTWFVNAVPEKVCYHAAELILQGFLPECQPGKKSSEKEEFRFQEPSKRLKGLEYEEVEEEDVLLADKDLKAVKDDDAVADDAMWDEYMVRSFEAVDHEVFYEKIGIKKVALNQITVKVCTKDFTPDHERLCKALRMLTLRCYRRNLRKSFCCFLKRKYGLDVLDLWSSRRISRRESQKRTHDDEPTTSDRGGLVRLSKE